jgi:hypothetical protein
LEPPREPRSSYHPMGLYSEKGPAQVRLQNHAVTVLEGYLTLLERQYKRDPRLPPLSKLCAALRDTIKTALEGVIHTRGSHIHEARFKDNDIDRLGGIGLLARNGKDAFAKAMHIFYKIEHARIRKRWKDQISGNNKAVRKLLNLFFDALYVVVFEPKTNTLHYPARLKF